MSDYVNCPTCHGRGVIPLEEAARIETHTSTSYEQQQAAQRQRQADVHARILKERTEAAERRIADLNAVLFGKPREEPPAE